jgi:predicted patatin/cPLA2 family phospholipase
MQESLIGKLNISGNFNFVYCDPYGLAEYVFGMKPKGILKEFEHYAWFWSVNGVENVSAMRSPLTWRAEVNKLNLKFTNEMQDWYKYIRNGVIYNMWGLDRETHSSMDFDGDIIATTKDETILRCRYGGSPVIYSSQKVKKDIIEIN